MSATNPTTNDSSNQPVQEAGKMPGDLKGRKVAWGKTPLFVALGLLGLIGVTAATVGLARFGGHNGWWSIGGSVGKLSPLASEIMMGTGSGGALLLAAGIILKSRKSKSAPAPAPKERDGLPILDIKKDADGKAIFDRTKTYEFSAQQNIRYCAVFNQMSQKWFYFPKDRANAVMQQLNSHIDGRTFLLESGDWISPPPYLPAK